MPKLKSISPSRIKTFDTCLFKYYLTYIDEAELKSNWGAVHGSLLHDVLENYSNGEDTNWFDRLLDGYSGELKVKNRDGENEIMPSPLLLAKAKDYKEKIPDCDICEYKADEHCGISMERLDALSGCPKMLFDNSITMIQNVIDRYTSIWPKILKNKDGQLIGTEYGFNIVLDGTDVPMIGFMDLVLEEDPETIHIIDYKTGSWAQNYSDCHNDIQAQMYSLAARREFIEDIGKRGYKYKSVILTFDYFTKSPITLAFSKEEDEKTALFVKNKIRQIESLDWITRIVPDSVNFNERTSNNGFKYFKCKSLCDSAVCASKWQGKFKLNGTNK